MRVLLRLSVWLVATALVLVLARAGFADDPMVTVTPGFGMTWPDSKLGLEKTTAQFGGILGVRILPVLAVEGRGHFARVDSRTPGADDLDILHGEGNLTWWPLPEATLRPYLTAGAGVVNINEENKLAVNGGIGVATSFVSKCAWRIDVRDVAYQLEIGTEKEWLHSYEFFSGLAIGFGGKPKDTDLDGIPDKLDQCPDTPAGAVVDAKGCPLDGDGDGVYDGFDMCAATPKGATVDAKGCPKDTDGDGVYDGLDLCAATTKGCVVDAAGCPKDADRDGVCDGLDQCPGTPPMTKVDAKGCPIPVSERETQLRDRGEIRLQNVNFVTAKAELMPESYPALDEVGEVLARFPELKIEIGGYTDSRGADAANQKLSQARAQAVLDYLVSKFSQLDRANFTVVGYGEAKPVATNDTETGRAENRRVEFRVLNPEALKR